MEAGRQTMRFLARSCGIAAAIFRRWMNCCCIRGGGAFETGGPQSWLSLGLRPDGAQDWRGRIGKIRLDGLSLETEPPVEELISTQVEKILRCPARCNR